MCLFPLLGKSLTDGWMAISQPPEEGIPALGQRLKRGPIGFYLTLDISQTTVDLTWFVWIQAFLLGLNHAMLFPFWASKSTPSPRVSSSSTSLNVNSDKKEKQSSFFEPNTPHLFFPSPNMQTVYLENQVAQLLLYIIPNRHVCSHPATALWGSYEMISSIFPGHI